MGKYDYITKEQLYNLYIVQNLSKPEMKEILGEISYTQLGRMLDKYGIKKTPEQLKEMQSRVLNKSYAEHPERKLKVKQTLQNTWEKYSEEERNKRTAPLIKASRERDDVYKAKNAASLHKFYETESEEHKRMRIEKARIGTTLAMKNMDPVKKAQMNKKRADTIRNHSPERKALTNKRRAETMAKKTAEERKNIAEKSLETKKINGTLWKSNFEKEVKEYIESLGFKTTKFICGYKENRFEIDIYIPELNFGIECDGCWYHAVNGPNAYPKKYHFNKTKTAKEQGIELIHVWEDWWKNKNEIIKDIIARRLNKKPNIIYARKCIIKEIDNTTYREFCINNHIQGYKAATVKLGLFYNDNLVCIASFSKCVNFGKYKAKYEYEWVRGASLLNTTVVGGTSRLFKHFISIYNPISVLCYTDNNLFNGNIYLMCGFKLDGHTGPDLFFFKNSPLKRIARNPFKYKEFEILVKKRRILKCYGAGNLRFIWQKV